MRLARTGGEGRHRLTLVPMIDVLMILLIFFMVTSTYLHLDTLPLAGGERPGAGAGPGDGETVRLMVRIDAGGTLHFRGQARAPAELAALVVAEGAAAEVLLLPSAQADVQALATAMDAMAAAGVTRLRVVRLEAQP